MHEQLFIFTAGSDQAYQHYIDTIEEGFSLDSISQFIDDDLYQKINKCYSDKKIRAWGQHRAEHREEIRKYNREYQRTYWLRRVVREEKELTEGKSRPGNLTEI